MKDKVFGVLQRVGRSFMLPIAILPVAGLFLGIGSSFTNETMLKAYNLMDVMGPGTILYAILKVLSACGDIIFANLPIIFAIGVAVGMAKNEKAVAGLSSAIAFFVMHSAISAMIEVNGGAENFLDGATATVCGINSLQMGAFGGIIVGLGVAALHNKYYKIKLPQVLAFFGGTRFVPIISSVVFAIVGIAMYFIWPPIQGLMYKAGELVSSSGYGGTFIYGVIERALIPFGLHHVFYTPFWQTAVGGTALIDGNMIEGAQNIFFAELASPHTNVFSVAATRFMSGKFPVMMFGLPGAALAMYKCADKKNRKEVGGLLFSAALTSFLTGITEPIEFTFLFLAPVLYAVHCVLAGFSFMIMHILEVGVGMTFSGGFIDFLLFGVLQGNEKTNWIYILIVGVAYSIIYYFVFTFMIKKFNINTPGRGDSDNKLYTRADVNEAKEKKAKKEKAKGAKEEKEEVPVQPTIDPLSELIIEGLGGIDNIEDVDCCATRLRVTVVDFEKVSDIDLKQSGAAGVIKKGKGIQVVYGPEVAVIKSNLEEAMHMILAGAKTAPMVEEKTEIEAAKEDMLKMDYIDAPNKFNKTVTILAPMKGEIKHLEDLDDDVFSEKMLGEGIAIEPIEGKLYSPVDGVIENIFDTKHAITIRSDRGVEILIHIGLNTVELGGKYFTIFAEENSRVTAGDLLATFDMDGIKSEGYEVTTSIIVIDSEDYEDISYTNSEKVFVFDPILYVR